MLNSEYWQKRYLQDDAPWDIGAPSTPLKEYVDQLVDKNLRILIPGCGNSYEAEYILQKGFRNIHLLDYSLQPLTNFKTRNPSFPDQQLHCQDFFSHKGTYDLILEQTFFCALDPSSRVKYAEHVHSLLAESGKLTGLLFDCYFEKDGPPFGGNRSEYESCFQALFHFQIFEKAYNSIAARADRELFIILKKRSLSSR